MLHFNVTKIEYKLMVLEGILVFFTKYNWIRRTFIKGCDKQFGNSILEGIAIWFVSLTSKRHSKPGSKSLRKIFCHRETLFDYFHGTIIFFLICFSSWFLKAWCTCRSSSIAKWKLVSLIFSVAFRWFLWWRNKGSISMPWNSIYNSYWRHHFTLEMV